MRSTTLVFLSEFIESIMMNKMLSLLLKWIWFVNFGTLNIKLPTLFRKVFIYFDDVELIYAHDKNKVCMKYIKLSQIHDKPKIPVYHSSCQFVLDLCLYIVNATKFIIVIYFCLPQKYLFYFLLMLRAALAKMCWKNLPGKHKLHSSQ